MDRHLAVLVAAVALAGCRSPQPATNPFLRTTVAPPATGQAAVVVPGEPYVPPGALAPVSPPGAAAPVAPAFPQSTAPMTMPQPVAPVAPSVVTPAVPAAPPPAVAPPPPVAVPPKDKFSPPGGSFQYNQSSLDRSKSPGRASRDWVTLASYREPTRDARADREVDESTDEAVFDGDGAAPPRLLARDDASQGAGNTIRILPPGSRHSGPRLADDEDGQEVERPARPNPVIRMTVDDGEHGAVASNATFRQSSRGDNGQPAAQITVVMPQADADTTDSDDDN